MVTVGPAAVPVVNSDNEVWGIAAVTVAPVPMAMVISECRVANSTNDPVLRGESRMLRGGGRLGALMPRLCLVWMLAVLTAMLTALLPALLPALLTALLTAMQEDQQVWTVAALTCVKYKAGERRPETPLKGGSVPRR